MVATMADLTQKNQELTREVNKHCWQRLNKEYRQNLENGGAENSAEGGD